MLTAPFRRYDRGLRHHTAIVFHFDIQTVMRQHPMTELQDLGQALGGQAMFRVVSDMSLEEYGFGFANDPAAVYEVFRGVSDFRDMGVRRNLVAVRQDETRECRGMLGKN